MTPDVGENGGAGGTPDLVVVLLKDVASQAATRALDAVAPGARLCVIAPQSDPRWDLATRSGTFHPATTIVQINWVLKMVGNPSAVIDLWSGTAEQHLGVWDRVLLHLRPGGTFSFERAAFASDDELAAVGDHLVDARRSVRAGTASGRARVLGEACGDLVLAEDRVQVTRVGHDLLVLREAEASRALASRAAVGSVQELEHRKATEFVSKGRTYFHPSDVDVAEFESTFAVPERRVRAYTGDVSVIGSCLAIKESAVLPESFRHQMEKRLRNPRLEARDAEFARMSDRDLPARDLPGTYYHLDASNSGHFGHLTTEVLSKFWGWDAARAHDPDVRAIFRVRHANERIPQLERALFGAYGISADQIQVISEPTRVETLVGATPQWHNQFPHYVDPAIAQTWERMAANLVDEAAAPVERLFVSRRDGLANRRCLNTADVERFFVERGFTVVYPEDYDMAGQATLFAGARVVAGFGGSALFNSMYARRLEAMLVLTHTAYTARNEHMYGAVLGADVHYFWSTPSIAHPEGGWSEEAYFSDWSFDFDLLGRELDTVIAQV